MMMGVNAQPILMRILVGQHFRIGNNVRVRYRTLWVHRHFVWSRFRARLTDAATQNRERRFSA